MFKIGLKTFFVIGLILILQGCVSSASGVPASFVDPLTFKDLSCEELISKKQEKANDLAVLSSKQDNARARAIAFNLVFK